MNDSPTYRFRIYRHFDWHPELHAACSRYEAAVNDDTAPEAIAEAKRAFAAEMHALEERRRPPFHTETGLSLEDLMKAFLVVRDMVSRGSPATDIVSMIESVTGIPKESDVAKIIDATTYAEAKELWHQAVVFRRESNIRGDALVATLECVGPDEDTILDSIYEASEENLDLSTIREVDMALFDEVMQEVGITVGAAPSRQIGKRSH